MANWTLAEGLLSDGLPMRLFLAEHDGALWATSMHDEVHPLTEEEFVWRLGTTARWQKGQSETLREAVAEVKDYSAGRRRAFDLPLALRGTDFQKRLWTQLRQIPFGVVQSYSEVAEAIGQEQACRAVGNANGHNNLPLFVPCHRVIAAGGKIGGFTGGLGLKKRLLAHEAATLDREKRPSDAPRKDRIEMREEGRRVGERQFYPQPCNPDTA
jgi:methylated-DNA-[protein]-cysteine S-methyltransferase